MRRIAYALLLGLFVVHADAAAQTPGTCEHSVAEAVLEAGNVRTRVFGDGSLTWRGAPHAYEVPKGRGLHTVFVTNMNVGGLVDGQLRVAASTYGPAEFWAGPLAEDGSPPSDCASFDRVWDVSRSDVANYEATGFATPDLADWPTGLGAPTMSAEGIRLDLSGLPLSSRLDRRIDLDAGERPMITGDQMLWWIMNDQGNVHHRTETPPIGLEVHGSAFSFDQPGALGNATFYRMKLVKPGGSPFEEAYLQVFQDPDIGNFDDDYVGSDSLLGLSFAYNSDNDDQGDHGYGDAPPATGLDFFQTPVVDSDGRDNDWDGAIDEPGERLSMNAFTFYVSGASTTGTPITGEHFYNYMLGLWRDGTPMTYGEFGYRSSESVTPFQFSGMPPSYWSEFDRGGGVSMAPSDRRYVTSVGPFSVAPGEPVEITWGLLTSFGSDNLNSVLKLKEDDVWLQNLADHDFQSAERIAPPTLSARTDDGSILLTWDNPPESNNHRESFEVIDPLLSPDVTDRTLRFEGYNLYQFDGPNDPDGRLLAVFDLPNGITDVQGRANPLAVGTDEGVLHHHVIDGLTNYLDYHFGIQAYAYNPGSNPPVRTSEISRLTVAPSPSAAILSEEASALFEEFVPNLRNRVGSLTARAVDGNRGEADISANVIDPWSVTGRNYTVTFDADAPDQVTSSGTGWGLDDPVGSAGQLRNCRRHYAVTRDDGQVMFSGAAEPNGSPGGIGVDIARFDGISLNVFPGQPDFSEFLMVAGPSEFPLPNLAAPDWEGFPNPQSNTRRGDWMVHVGLPEGDLRHTYSDFLRLLLRGACNATVPFDYEIRFTEEGSLHYDRFGHLGGGIQPGNVPFELWNLGVGTPDDPSDDFRLVPAVIDWEGDGWGLRAIDHPMSGGLNDPQTDWIYWIQPEDTTPGTAGYDAWASNALAGGDPDELLGAELMARMLLVSWNGALGDANDPTTELRYPEGPPVGMTIRIETVKAAQPGDGFVLSTAGLEPRAKTREEGVSELASIGISPNPFRAYSLYSVSLDEPQVRITGLPGAATIRVFTMAGSLVKTIRTNGPDRWVAWDLRTDADRPVAGGLYLVHVETEYGATTLRFGVLRPAR